MNENCRCIRIVALFPVILLVFALATLSLAQDTNPDAERVAFPAFIRYSGALLDPATRLPLQGTHSVRFSIYDEAQNGKALWTETQQVDFDGSAPASVLVGLTSLTGIPASVLAGPGNRWLAVQIDEIYEQPRIRLAAAPYALRAATADTLSGYRASDFVLTSDLQRLLAAPATATSGPTSRSLQLQGPSTLSPAITSTSTSSSATSFNDTNDTQVVYVGQQGTGYAVRAETVSGITLYARNTATTGTAFSIYGAVNSPSGAAVRGDALSASASGIGVWGVSFASGGTGVLGEAAGSGTNFALRGKNTSTSGTAVFGQSLANSGYAIGVRGETHSPNGIAGYFDAQNGGTILAGRSGGSTNLFVVDGSGNVSTAGNVNATGSMNAASVNAPAVNATNVTATASVSATNLSALNAITAGTASIPALSSVTVNVTNSLTAPSITATDTLSATTVAAGGASFTGPVTAAGMNLAPTATATASAAADSNALTQSAAVYNSATGQSESYSFRTVASGMGNNTSAPSAVLKFQSAGPDQAFGDTGLSINRDGSINFAPTQIFPSTLQVSTYLGDSSIIGTPDLEHGQGGFIRDDQDTVHSYIRQAGSQIHFRLSRATPDATGARDFLIVPYNYGMAIEYPGLIEIWSAGLSVHHNNQLQSTALPADFWVGDEIDSGGLNITAYQKGPTESGRVVLAADKFDHTSHGSMYFFVRNPDDAFRFFQGPYSGPSYIAQLMTDSNSTHLDLNNGPLSGSLQVLPSGTIRLFSTSSAPVELASGSNNLTLFPSGHVSIGNRNDSALLSVGNNGQFSVASSGAVTMGAGQTTSGQLWVSDGVSGGMSVTPVQGPSGGGLNGHVSIAAEKLDHSSHGSLYLTTRNKGDAVRFAAGPSGAEALIGQLFTMNNASSLELYSGGLAGSFKVDASQGAVQFGSRSSSRVDIVTADNTPRVSLFPNGNVAVGSTSDPGAKFAVGTALKVSSTGVAVGGGTEITKHMSVVGTVSYSNLGPGCQDSAVTVTGAADSDTVALGVPSALASVANLTWFGWVSAADTVSVRACSMATTAIPSLSGTVRIDVWKH